MTLVKWASRGSKCVSTGGNTLVTQTTDANGNYLIEELLPGQYFLVFVNHGAEGVFTLKPVGADDASDSDIVVSADLPLPPDVAGLDAAHCRLHAGVG